MTQVAPPVLQAAHRDRGQLPGRSARAGSGRGARGGGPGWVLLRLAFAAAAGLLTDAGFPGLGWWPLAPVGVGLLVLLVRGTSRRTALAVGATYAVAFLAPHLRWTGTYVGAGPWLALVALEAVLLAPVALAVRELWAARWPRLAVVVGAGGAWVAQEALRGRVPFGGFPWARLGFSQADSAVSLLAPLGGAPLMSWAVATSGALLSVAAVTAAGWARGGPSRRWGALAAGSAALLAGLVPLLPRPPVSTQAEPVARIGVVQGDVPRAGLDFNAERRAVLDNHARLTRELAARGEDLDAVVWPENSSDIDPLLNADAGRVVQEAVDAVDVPLLVGAVLREGDETLRNAALVWEPSSTGRPRPSSTYLKRQVVPFGEYIPLRPLVRAVTDKVDLVPRDFVGGDDDAPVRLGPLRAAVGICYEVAFDGLLRRSVAAGADLLVIPTNNATFGYTDQSTQQLAMSRIRAMEFGMTVVQASTTGVSAIIGPDGRTSGTTELYQPALLVGDVAASPGQTPATRYGGAVELVLAGLGLVAVAAAAASARRVVRPSSCD